MSFKNITDDDIKYCEEEIRKIGASIEIQLNDTQDESADMNCEKDEQYLVQTFGTFSENPSKFRFQRGELSLIKQLVEHVKEIVDGNGMNTGLERFKYKDIRPRKARSKRAQADVHPNTKRYNVANSHANVMQTRENEPDELKANLFCRIKMCLDNYQAGIDVELLSENIVDIQIDNNKVTAKVDCVLCENKKPKKIYYDCVSGNWVITNFQKHLKTSHHLRAVVRDFRRQKLDVEIVNNTDNEDEKAENISSVNLISVDNRNKIDLRVSGNNTIKIENDDNWLYDQLAAQINTVMSAVFTNGEEEDIMALELKKTIIHLSVAKILGDGNCLFAAIVHQLWQYPINSKQHKEAMKQLRSKVVEYILANYESFEFNLKDRVYELKHASQITNMTAECKSYVKNVLSRDGEYGGFETIKAVSEMFLVNILTFVEDGECSFYNTKKIYNKTIAIAWRNGFVQSDGVQIRNHYDSVYEVKPEDLLSVSESVINKQIKTNINKKN